MKKGTILIIVSTMIMLFALAGCGGNINDSKETKNGEEVTALALSSDGDKSDKTGNNDSNNGETQNGTTRNDETQVVEQAITQQIAEQVDADSSVGTILGNWIDINDESRFAKITKDGGAYLYEDNEGKYSAEFIKGILKVKLSETDTADVYIDVGSGNLKLVYLDSISEFQKKQ